MNTPRGSGADNLPPDWTQPLYFGSGPQAADDASGFEAARFGAGGSGPGGGGGSGAGGPGGAGRWRRAGQGARWTATVAAPVAIAGASVLGVSLASGGSSSAGTSPAASTALTTNAAVQVAAASAGGAGHPASFRAIGSGRRVADARACIRSAGRLRRAGRIAAARARFRACLRQYPRLRFLVKLRAIVRHAEHGQVTFATRKGTRTLVFERGIIQSASAGSVVVKAADGTTWTWHPTSSTVVTSGGHRATASALKAGRAAVLVGLVNSGANDARRIFVKS
ncbi:MAG: hypothetical protein ACR2FU_19090 [Streptosporangiaceae bacterium]